MALKKITKENTPPSAVPYRNVNNPFRFQFVIPGKGVTIEEDKNGICYISADGIGMDDLVAGDNIGIDRTEDGNVVISSVDTATDIAAGQNITIDIDPETGTAIINSVIGGTMSEHYQGVFDTPEDLIAYDTDPETGDYGMVKEIIISDGTADSEWTGRYKYCFYINGQWTVVDQMLTFTKNLDLLKQFYSVGGSSPVIYLHEIARSGNFWDLNNVPIVATPEVTVEGTTVAATCATEGADIWYTTDGTMPHVNGTKYTGPITINDATLFRFVGVKNGMINSEEAVISADYGLEAPEIELDWHDGTITLTNPNVDGNNDPVGTIYYTLDGSEPTNASNAYTGPFVLEINAVSGVRTVKAVVYDGGNTMYSPVSASTFRKAYTAGSRGSGAGTGNITDYWYATDGSNTGPVEGGEVHYTTDGATPDYNSERMTAALSYRRYGGPYTFKVIGFIPGFVPSTVRNVSIGYDKPTAPVITFNTDDNTVRLSGTGNVTASPAIPFQTDNNNPSFGYRIYYTLDGSTPTEQSTLYTAPFQITQNTTVRAIVVAYGQYYSDVATENIVITAEPTISMNHLNGQITIEGPAGANIYYTLDGSTPTEQSTLYTGPIKDLPQLLSRTVKAVSVINSQASAVVSATYTRVIGELPNHQVNYNYSAGLIAVSAPGIPNGADMMYAIDDPGADIVEAEYSAYTAPVSIDYFSAENPRIVIFKAVRVGNLPFYQYSDSLGSDEADAPVITVDEDTDLVTISLDGNTADIPLQTNDNAPMLGARIYYTTDGSTPTDQSTLYIAPFTLPEGSTAIKAITVCYGEWESDVTTEEVGPAPVAGDYMYFEAAEANSTVSMMSMLATAPDLEYSTDGATWQEWQHTTADGVHTFDTLTLTAVGDRVYLRGYNPNGFSDLPRNPKWSNFSMTGKIKAGGNIMSLLDKTMVLTSVPDSGFTVLFGDLTMQNPNTALLTPPAMDNITTIHKYGCAGMCVNCTSLTSVADMPSLTVIGEQGCINMYNGCTSLTSAADMPQLTYIVFQGCADMYNGCIFAMSSDGTTLNFDFPTPPITTLLEPVTYSTAYDVAEWMGNTNGFTNP